MTEDTLADQERAYRDAMKDMDSGAETFYTEFDRVAGEAVDRAFQRAAEAEQRRCDLVMETARNEALGLGEIIYLD